MSKILVLDSLAEGEILTQLYEVTIDDGSPGGTATETVEITITGSNDAPVIDVPASDLSGAVTELTDGSVPPEEENNHLHEVQGDIEFADVDLIDTHVGSFVEMPGLGDPPYVGTFALTPIADGSGVLSWTFDVEDSVLDSLAEGEILTQLYEVTITDSSGDPTTESATEIVTITITGANDNDGPVIVPEIQTSKAQ